MLLRSIQRLNNFRNGFTNPHFNKSYLLKGGRVVNSDFSEKADVLIKDDRVEEVSSNIEVGKETEVINCEGRLIIPGGIDTHTHMQLPFMGTSAKDDFDIGSKAALIGGTTSFIDFAIPNKGESLTSAVSRWRQMADGHSNCDYALHCAITQWDSNTPNEMKKVVNMGISSFKFFMAYNKVLRVEDETLFKAFETARDLGALCLVHAQNGDIIEINQKKLFQKGITGPEGHYLSRPQSVQADAVHRAITLAEYAQCPLYIVHIMSKMACDQILRAKLRGNIVFSQTLAAGLGVDGRKLWDRDWDVASRYVMSPPISPDPTTKTHLMKMVNSNIVDVIGTDNCTFCTEQKRLGKGDFRKIPNGVNGAEDRMSVVWTKGVKTGLMSENEFVRATSSQAARLFNMFPRKGVVRKGSDADIVIWDPQAKKTISKDTHNHNIDYNIFEGMEVQGQADYTFSAGKLVWDGKKFNKNTGRYVTRTPFGYAYARHKQWVEQNDPLKQKVERSDKQQSKDNKSQVDTLKQKIKRLEEENKRLRNNDEARTEASHFQDSEFNGVEPALKAYLPHKIYENVRQILYGNKCEEPHIGKDTAKYALKHNFQIKKYSIPALKEQLRKERRVTIGAIQNKIVKPTTESVRVQKDAIIERVVSMINAAAMEKANIVCMQEIWNAPFFMCTRQRYPWIEFSEPVRGQSTQILMELAKKHNMVIISSILERDEVRATLHNTAVIIDNHGQILGTQVKGHIPRVGDFNESTYYMEGNSGHPVFDTEFGKIGVNICYGRHHPLNWMAFGLNGAEVVFNPSATIGGLSEPIWPIEARNAAIANHYFAVGINRIGTEVYPHAFTSGDGKPAHKDFGHFYGSSYVAAPDGCRTPGLSRNRDGLLLTNIDLNMCQQVKDKWGFTMTARYEQYAQLLSKFVKQGYIPQTIRREEKKE